MNKCQYRYYMLFLLTLVSTSNLLDRFVLSLAIEPIKQEFQLSDSQIGFLTGFAFALFYAVAGIPIARWSDRGNRNTIVAITTGLWSAMVALSGLVSNYFQLLCMRIGIAVGEAGCWPPAQSLIAEYFSRAERPQATAIYTMAGPLAVLLGYFGGGWLVEYFGWRMTFIVMGTPGVLLAILVKLTLREPRLAKGKPEVVEQPSFQHVLSTLGKQQTFRCIVIAFCAAYFFGAGIVLWMPTFFMRSHGMEVGEVGTWFALTWGGFGFLGTYLGGVLASRYAAGKEALQMRGCALVFVVSSLLYPMFFLASNKYQAIALMAALAFVFALVNGPVFSSIQSLVSDRMRSMAIALIFLLANLIGYGMGPLAVGALSDLLAPIYGLESLRYASLIFSPWYLFVAFYYWKAGKTIEADIRAVESHVDSIVSKIGTPTLSNLITDRDINLADRGATEN